MLSRVVGTSEASPGAGDELLLAMRDRMRLICFLKDFIVEIGQ